MLVYGLDRTGTEFVGQIVNGNGKEESGEDHLFDQDNRKNFGLRINQDIGILSLGAYIYHGNEIIEGAQNRIFYWGPDLNGSIGPIELTAQYLERKDSNPGLEDRLEILTRGTVVEAIYSPKLDKSRYFITILYNEVDSDLISLNYQTMSLSTTYLLARNLRLTAEYGRDLKEDKNRFIIGLISGF